MTLTKKNFKAIAEILNCEVIKDAKSTGYTEEEKEENNSGIERLIVMFSEYFAKENPAFDRKKFKEAVLEGI